MAEGAICLFTYQFCYYCDHLHTGRSSVCHTVQTPRILSCPPGRCRGRQGTWPGTSSGSPPRSPPAPRPCRPEPEASYREQTQRKTYSANSSESSDQAELFRVAVGVLHEKEASSARSGKITLPLKDKRRNTVFASGSRELLRTSRKLRNRRWVRCSASLVTFPALELQSQLSATHSLRLRVWPAAAAIFSVSTAAARSNGTPHQSHWTWKCLHGWAQCVNPLTRTGTIYMCTRGRCNM